MKKIITALALFATIAGVSFVVYKFITLPTEEFKKLDYVGMTRDEILTEVNSYDKVLDNKIMLAVGPGLQFYYFETIDDIRKNSKIINRETWLINFKQGLIRKYFFEIKFKDNIVIGQNIKWFSGL
jgi:hypothetical protein